LHKNWGKRVSRKGAKAQRQRDLCIGKVFRPQSGKIINYFSLGVLSLCVPIAIGMASLRETKRRSRKLRTDKLKTS